MSVTKKTVTVFGAGISGLTAAHELAIRGFTVRVIDKEINPYVWDKTLDWGIGGIARSQYFARSYSDSYDQPAGDRPVKIPALQPVHSFMYDEVLEFTKGTSKFADPAAADKFLRDVVSLAKKSTPIALSLRTTDDDGRNGAIELTKQRRQVLADVLGPNVAILTRKVPAIAVELDWVSVNADIRVFAGEHGFRFFPSFYRHLFDTMRRTPILNPRDSERGIRTVFQNLVPVDELGFARGGNKKSFTLPRKPVLSFELLRQNLRKIRTELEYTYEDLLRLELALFKYLTSCSERRKAEYEHISWSELIDLTAYSAILREHLEYGPQMALGLRGSKADARTQGNVVTQLLRDQVTPNQQPDSLLDGPTSASWFEHWADFLRTQGVSFHRGTLVRFVADRESKQVEAWVRGDSEQDKAWDKCDYYVVAIDLPHVDKLVDSLRKQ
ncbi:MAG TPA: NAD(P)-binding protein [Polyangiales bacterium]|jgi:hypothetical protein|nr:NAD(P)-binding protein [Polyangiales bacterium]